MAEQTIILLEDDLDGGKADETVLFGLDGVEFEIDLSEANAVRLRTVMARYTAAGRRVRRTRDTGRRQPRPEPVGRRGKSTRQVAGRPDKLTPTQAAAVRQWARQRGLDVADKGRLRESVVNAYFSQ